MSGFFVVRCSPWLAVIVDMGSCPLIRNILPIPSDEGVAPPTEVEVSHGEVPASRNISEQSTSEKTFPMSGANRYIPMRLVTFYDPCPLIKTTRAYETRLKPTFGNESSRRDYIPDLWISRGGREFRGPRHVACIHVRVLRCPLVQSEAFGCPSFRSTLHGGEYDTCSL